MSEGISVVIPAYNAASWLRSTTDHLTAALEASGAGRHEIIVVDDGSTDDTARTAEALPDVRLLRQENKGRFLARKAGVDAARYDTIWFVDTRVHVDHDSLKYALAERRKDPSALVWNGHVNVHKKGNLIARFMDAVTFIGWRRYFGRPRRCSYGLKDFDYYPKGTTCFMVPKTILEAAMDHFMRETTDLRNSSDDTLLIRLIAADNDIQLSPRFSCTYFARTSLKSFIKHTYNRGKFFVDGFLRPGTRFYRPLQLFLAGTAAGLLVLAAWPSVAVYYAAIFLFVWLLEFAVAIGLGVPFRDAASLWALSPIFAVVYGLGIWSAVLKLAAKKVSGRTAVSSQEDCK